MFHRQAIASLFPAAKKLLIKRCDLFGKFFHDLFTEIFMQWALFSCSRKMPL